MEISTFNREFYKMLHKYSSANSLIKSLSDCGEILLFGGAVREFNDTKFNNIPRDFDIVVKKKNINVNLDEILINYDFKKNRFNGYKIVVDSLEFDIWEIENTWAFKEKKIRCSEEQYIEKLQDTVFLNVDSLVYNITKQKVYNSKYENAMKQKTLDIVLLDNPYIELNMLRAILFKKKYDMKFSNRLIKLFNKYFNREENFIDKLYDIQFSHYHECKIEKKEIEYEIKIILE